MRDGALDRGLTGLDQRVVDLLDVEQLGRRRRSRRTLPRCGTRSVFRLPPVTSTSTSMSGLTRRNSSLPSPSERKSSRLRGASQDAEPVEGGAELAVAGDLQHRTVAAQHVRPVGGQGGDRGLPDDPHPATDRAYGDLVDPAGVDRLARGGSVGSARAPAGWRSSRWCRWRAAADR